MRAQNKELVKDFLIQNLFIQLNSPSFSKFLNVNKKNSLHYYKRKIHILKKNIGQNAIDKLEKVYN